jgi:multiple sugar transport system ATP-binding protein
MNLYSGTVHFTDDVATLTLGGHVLGLSPECLVKQPRLREYDGKEIIIGIRPEDFEDAAFAEAPESQRITSTVSLLEALGSEIMVHFRLDAPSVDSGDPDAVVEKAAVDTANAVGRFNPRSTARMGESIEIAVATENMHFFDPDTRQAIWA